jgi:co-chaperonin GroES (HSP10)
MKITPLRDIVVVRADPAPEKSKSGLIVKEEWKSLPPMGEVIAVGPWVEAVKPGDRVIFDRYASVIMEDNLRLCQESHLHATI